MPPTGPSPASPTTVVAIAGFVAGPINPLLMTVIQESTPPELAGRVFGSLGALAQVGIPIGAAVVGFAVQGAGLLPTILAMGLLYVGFLLAMFFNPALRRMEAAGGGA